MVLEVLFCFQVLCVVLKCIAAVYAFASLVEDTRLPATLQHKNTTRNHLAVCENFHRRPVPRLGLLGDEARGVLAKLKTSPKSEDVVLACPSQQHGVPTSPYE